MIVWMAELARNLRFPRLTALPKGQRAVSQRTAVTSMPPRTPALKRELTHDPTQGDTVVSGCAKLCQVRPEWPVDAVWTGCQPIQHRRRVALYTTLYATLCWTQRPRSASAVALTLAELALLAAAEVAV